MDRMWEREISHLIKIGLTDEEIARQVPLSIRDVAHTRFSLKVGGMYDGTRQMAERN